MDELFRVLHGSHPTYRGLAAEPYGPKGNQKEKQDENA